MNDPTDVLLEKALAGALTPEEAAEFDALLAADPSLRERLDAWRRDEGLLADHAAAGLARVDWSRVRRLRLRLGLDQILRPLALSALCAAVLWYLVTADSWWDRLGMTLWSLISGSWAANAWIERARTRRRLDWMEEDGADFLERYRIVVEREWQKYRRSAEGIGCAAVFLILLAIFGRHPEACLAALAVIVLVRTYEHVVVLRPLRREREDLSA